MDEAPERRSQFTFWQLLAALTAIALLLGLLARWTPRPLELQGPFLLWGLTWLVLVALVAGLGILPLRPQTTSAAVRIEAIDIATRAVPASAAGPPARS